MSRTLRATAAAATAALAPLLLLGACATGPLTSGVDASGRRLVLLLDASTSMQENDPADAARVGVDLALGLAGARDNVAVVTFAESAEVRVPLQPAGGTAARAARRTALAGVQRNGASDVANALVVARDVLAEGGAPRGSAIVFLTDGVPYTQARGRRLARGESIDEAVASIAARGWRIFAIALGEEASTPFLTRLVASTGGSVVRAKDAAALAPAFEAVATEALGYLRAERGREVTVLPGTRRLAFVGAWAPGGAPGGAGPGVAGAPGVIGALAHDGAPADEAQVIRTPDAGAAKVAVALVETPAPGRWSAPLEGATTAVALLEPSFSLDFAPGVPAAIAAGAQVPLALRLEGDPAAVQDARGRLALRGRIERDGQPGAWVALSKALIQGDGPGERALTAPVVESDAAATLVVEAELVEGGRSLVLRRTRALTITGKGGPRPAEPVVVLATLDLALEPATFQRAAWADEALEPVTLTVRGDPSRAVRVRAGGRALELAAGAKGELEAPVPPDGVVVVQAEAEGCAPWTKRIEGQVARARLTAPARITLPAAAAGMTASAPFAPSASLQDPAAAATLEVTDLELRGPGGAKLTLVHQDGALVASTEAATPPGTYRGTLEVALTAPDALRGLRPRRIPVEVTVQAPPRAPASLALTGGWGWTSAAIEVRWPGAQEVPVTITPSALIGPDGARIDPRWDLRVSPLEGWSGERLGPEPRRLALEVFLSSDLPGGEYGGEVVVQSGASKVVVPVRLEVRR